MANGEFFDVISYKMQKVPDHSLTIWTNPFLRLVLVFSHMTS